MGRTHGETVGGRISREYLSWRGARARCNNPNEAAYRNYGGRGIRMCKRWEKSFAAFLRDMGRCPPGRSLDRVDVNGDYKPGNCRWATRLEQNRNRRDSVYLELAGARKHRNEWAEELGLTPLALYKRLRTRPFAEVVERIKRGRNRSGRRGVNFDARRGKWYAQRVVNGRRLYAGEFDTPEEAAVAYEKLNTFPMQGA